MSKRFLSIVIACFALTACGGGGGGNSDPGNPAPAAYGLMTRVLSKLEFDLTLPKVQVTSDL